MYMEFIYVLLQLHHSGLRYTAITHGVPLASYRQVMACLYGTFLVFLYRFDSALSDQTYQENWAAKFLAALLRDSGWKIPSSVLPTKTLPPQYKTGVIAYFIGDS